MTVLTPLVRLHRRLLLMIIPLDKMIARLVQEVNDILGRHLRQGQARTPVHLR